MSYTLYNSSIGVATDAVNTISMIITKAAASPSASTIPSARIHENMKPFSFQVHTATDWAQKVAARLTGKEILSLEDNLTTFEAMQERVKIVLALLAEADKASVNGRTDEDITFAMRAGQDVTVKGWQYVHAFALPNIYFHMVTAYDIARKEGVELGKLDYMTSFAFKFLQGQI